MVLLSFSVPEHVPKLLNGAKVQTTRIKRKNPLEVGAVLQCYYKSRVRKLCWNCIVADCKYSVVGESESIPCVKCSHHTNYFGEADIVEILPLEEALKDPELFARLDGFSNFEEADKWFRISSGVDKNWMDMPYEVIRFEPRWLNAGVV